MSRQHYLAGLERLLPVQAALDEQNERLWVDRQYDIRSGLIGLSVELEAIPEHGQPDALGHRRSEADMILFWLSQGRTRHESVLEGASKHVDDRVVALLRP